MPQRKQRRKITSFVKTERVTYDYRNVPEEHVPGTFYAQPFKFAPRLLNAGKPTPHGMKVRLEAVKGVPLSVVMRGYDHGEAKTNIDPKTKALFARLAKSSGVSREWVLRNVNPITRQLARHTAQLYLKGVFHQDLGDSNVLVSKSKSGRPAVKIVDWEFAETTHPEMFEPGQPLRPQKDYHSMKGRVLNAVVSGLADAKKDQVRDLFEREFEKTVRGQRKRHALTVPSFRNPEQIRAFSGKLEVELRKLEERPALGHSMIRKDTARKLSIVEAALNYKNSPPGLVAELSPRIAALKAKFGLK